MSGRKFSNAATVESPAAGDIDLRHQANCDRSAAHPQPSATPRTKVRMWSRIGQRLPGAWWLPGVASQRRWLSSPRRSRRSRSALAPRPHAGCDRGARAPRARRAYRVRGRTRRRHRAARARLDCGYPLPRDPAPPVRERERDRGGAGCASRKLAVLEADRGGAVAAPPDWKNASGPWAASRRSITSAPPGSRQQ
jgi:hypothetical protein